MNQTAEVVCQMSKTEIVCVCQWFIKNCAVSVRTALCAVKQWCYDERRRRCTVQSKSFTSMFTMNVCNNTHTFTNPFCIHTRCHAACSTKKKLVPPTSRVFGFLLFNTRYSFIHSDLKRSSNSRTLGVRACACSQTDLMPSSHTL